MTEPQAPSPIPFTPVPGRARRDGWTPARQHGFVAALSATGTVGAAARAVGMSARSAYALRRRAGEDSGFARAWDAAVERGCAEAFAVAVSRATQGVVVPVFFRGKQVGQYRRYDDRLALAAMRGVTAREQRRALEAIAMAEMAAALPTGDRDRLDPTRHGRASSPARRRVP